MGARIRQDGSIVCAAMHPERPGDVYVDDAELYRLATAGEWMASPNHLHAEGCDGENCKESTISASGSPVCGDGVWVRS